MLCLLRMCWITWTFWTARYGHSGHACGFSPVWVSMCRLRLLLFENTRWHQGHTHWAWGAPAAAKEAEEDEEGAAAAGPSKAPPCAPPPPKLTKRESKSPALALALEYPWPAAGRELPGSWAKAVLLGSPSVPDALAWRDGAPKAASARGSWFLLKSLGGQRRA